MNLFMNLKWHFHLLDSKSDILLAQINEEAATSRIPQCNQRALMIIVHLALHSLQFSCLEFSFSS